MTQSKKFAVTGGIGSGKSELCRILRRHGFAVFSCDEITAELWRQQDFLHELSLRFPDCCAEGRIDKNLLTKRVFSDPEARRALDDFTHPIIMDRLIAQMSNCAVAFAEVPLLYEGGYEGMFDGVIAVRRAEDVRIAAVMARDGLSTEQVRARMNSQLDASALAEKGCYILENNGSLAEMERKTMQMLRSLGI